MKRAACILSILLAAPVYAVTEQMRPNVLLISIDTLRADHLGCYGYKIKTPAIDELASRSLLFENAISQVPLTLPSHSTIFTGLYPDQHGVRNNENFVLPDKPVTLAEVFRKNGYATGAVVGSFSLDSIFGLNRGFQHYDDEIGQGHDPEINRNVERRAQTVWNLGREWLNTQKGPWFCFLHFFDPHSGYNPPAPHPQTYDGEIAYVDNVIGQISRHLTERDLWRTTIVVLLSDHGEGLNEHGEASHGVFLYDTTLRVPFLMALPSSSTARRVRAQVRLVDVAPTILSAAGLQTTPGFSGRSVLTVSEDLPAYSESYYTNLLMGWAALHSIRWNNRKWIDGPKPELYDLTKDPGESRNLYGGAVPPSFRNELLKHKKDPAPTAEAEVDEETKEKLASLGYVTGSSATPVESSFDPKDGIAVWNRIEYAVTLAQTGRMEDSVKEFQGALQEQPDNVIAHKFLANVLRATGQHEIALSHLNQALKSELHRADTRLQLARVYLDLKRPEQALASLQAILLEEPGHRQARRLAAFVALDLHKYEEAERHFNAFMQKDASDVEVLAGYARVESYLRKDRDALEAYRKLSAIRPLTDEEAIQVAAIHLTARNVDGAEEYFRMAVKANEHSVAAWKGIALIAAGRGRFSEAVEAFLNARDCENAKKLVNSGSGISDVLKEQVRKRCP